MYPRISINKGLKMVGLVIGPPIYIYIHIHIYIYNTAAVPFTGVLWPNAQEVACIMTDVANTTRFATSQPPRMMAELLHQASSQVSSAVWRLHICILRLCLFLFLLLVLVLCEMISYCTSHHITSHPITLYYDCRSPVSCMTASVAL